MTIPKFRKISVQKHGQIKSLDINSMQDSLEYDISYLYSRSSYLESRIVSAELSRDLTMMADRAIVEHLLKQEEENRLFRAYHGQVVNETKTFRTSRNIFFEHPTSWSISEDNRLRVDTSLGQVTLPYDSIVSRFYSVVPDTRSAIQVSDVEAELIPIKEPTPLKIVNTDLNSAFNGVNDEFWKREVWFPLHSDVEEVIVDVDVTVPVAIATKSNVIQIRPYPEGTVDIVHILYETSDSDPVFDLTDHAVTSWSGHDIPAYESSGIRGHFKPLGIQRLKVRLRQRNFVERNGFKVFVYGLQELGLFLVDFDSDDTNVSASSPINDKAMVVKFVSPKGYNFGRITSIVSNPSVGDDLVMAVYSDFALTNKLWDSNSPLPQSLSPIVTGNTNSIYVAVGMGYDQFNDVAPILDNLSLYYTTTKA